MDKRKNSSRWYWIIMFVVTAILCDGLVGIYLHLIVKPHEIEPVRGLPPSSALPVAHPYKSYMNRPGGTYWGEDQSLFSLNGQDYDYRLIKGGTVIDKYGHQVLRADLDLTERPKKAGEKRVLVLGGSTTFQPWPHLTAELLNFRMQNKRHFVAINAGTGGYTSQENVVDLILSGFVYDPDIVIAYLPVNDIYWAAYYPDFKRDYSHMRIPLKIVPTSLYLKPDFNVPSYPYSMKLVAWRKYKTEVEKYIANINLAHFVTSDTRAGGEALLDEANFKKTVDAIIDNILNMNVLCERRNVRFVLVTQKLFASSNPFYTYMDQQTTNAVRQIISSPKLKGVEILKLHEIFPDKWEKESIGRVQTNFPLANPRFDQGMAYDSMHFTPSALYLFASIMADHIQNNLKTQ